MKCPSCSGDKAKVVDSRQRGKRRVRRRHCADCQHRFMTTELLGNITDDLPLLKPMVTKKDGAIEVFDRQKLLQSLSIAVRKARRDQIPLDEIVSDIEQEATAAIDGPIQTSQIGERAMSALRQHDANAFLRYASVYKEMESPDDFKTLLNSLEPDESH